MTSSEEAHRRRETVEGIRGCCGCGTCAGMCPEHAIAMTVDAAAGMPVPSIDENQCVECGLCVEVCPVDSLMARTGIRSWRSGEDSHELLLGHAEGFYMGNAADPGMRYEGASGGLITSLATFALERGMVDGVLVTRMSETDPTMAEPFIARTKGEVVGAAKSKYCPTSTNVLIREILGQEGKVAVVGLPCQMRGLELACRASEELRGKIALRLGLFCSHSLNFHSTEFVLGRLGVDRRDVREMSYRAGGWPGSIRIVLEGGGERTFGLNSLLWRTAFGSFFFTPECCLRCGDLTSEDADISFGDAWLPEVTSTDRAGTSVAVSRTRAGQELMDQATGSGVISVQVVGADDVIASQRRFIGFKRLDIDGRVSSEESRGMLSLCPSVANRLGSLGFFRSMLARLPLKLVDMSLGAYYSAYDRSLRGRLEVRRRGR